MNLDDEVRRHLRDTGEQVALTPGMVDAVRIRAASRMRRRRFILRGLGSLIALTAIGGSVAVILRQGDEDPTPFAAASLTDDSQAPEMTSAGELVEGDSPASLASTSPTYESNATAEDEDTEITSTLTRESSESRWAKIESPVSGATTEYMYSGGMVLAQVGSQWFVRDESSWRELALPQGLSAIAIDVGESP